MERGRIHEFRFARSDINDELNLAAFDEGIATRLEQDFQRDLADPPLTYGDWPRRSLFERVHEWLGWIVEDSSEGCAS